MIKSNKPIIPMTPTKLLSLIFVILTIFNQPLFSEGIKVKIYQAATIDLEQILNLIESDETFKQMLHDYQSIQSSNVADINATIQKLEAYLEENPNFSSSKKKAIIDDISFQKNLLNALGVNGNGSQDDSSVFQILYEVIKKIADQEGFSMVIEKKTAIVYANEEIDITDRVITEIKNKFR